MLTTLLKACALLLSLVSVVVSQTPGFDAITSPANHEVLLAGNTHTIKWNPGSTTGTAMISLLAGPTSGTLSIVSTITAGIANGDGAFNWTLDSTLGADAVYGLQIALVSDPSTFQWSFPFVIASMASSATATSTTAVPTVSTGGVATITPTSTHDGPSSTPTTDAASGGDGSGLSKGMIAGISVAAVASFSLMASLLGLVLYYRRKAQARKPGPEDLAPGKPGLDGRASLGGTPRRQLAGWKSMEQDEGGSAQRLFDREGKSIPSEIKGASVPIEMYGPEDKSIPGEVFGHKKRAV